MLLIDMNHEMQFFLQKGCDSAELRTARNATIERIYRVSQNRIWDFCTRMYPLYKPYMVKF